MLFHSKLCSTSNRPTIHNLYLKFLISIFLSFTSYSSFSQVWVNEIHYDNSGGDVNECIEIVAPAGTDLTQYSIVLYNGSNGTQYETLTFSGLMPDEGCGFGTAQVCHSGIQNGAPDGLALIGPGSTVVQFLSYEGSFTAANGPANGMASTNIGVSETSSTPVGHSLQLTGTGDEYADFTWQSPSASSMGSLNTGQAISPCGGSSNTISTGTLTGATFNVDCTTSDNGTLTFASTGTFNAGNTFTAQLSNASGSFTAPTAIGSSSVNGTDPSGTINITIPGATPDGTNYRIRIVSSNPSTTSDTTAVFEIILTGEPCVLQPPHLTSVIINSCNGSCLEGDNELVFGNTGDYSVEVTAGNFNFFYGTSDPASTNYTDVLTTNPTTTAAINTDAGCAGTYVEGTGATMPPGSSFILASDALCVDALTWSGLCGQGPVYIIYQNDANWNSNGNFANSTSAGSRFFRTTITTTSGDSFTINYEYNKAANSGTDGDYATFSSSGGMATTQGDNNCVIEPILLPIELTHFSGEYVEIGNKLTWTTQTEINSDYYLLEKSTNGFDYDFLTEVPAAGSSTSELNYDYLDRDIANGIYYYRLTGVDYDGTKANHGIVAVHVKSSKIFFDQQNQMISIGDGKGISVYSLDGRLVLNAENESKVSFSKKGVFLILNQSTGETMRIINH